MKKLLFVLATLPAITSWSQGYQVNLQGQKQQAMASAGAAFAQDAAILFYNPGGATFLEKSELIVGATPTFGRGKFLDANTNATAETTSPTSFPFAVYGVFGLKKVERLKLGLAIYTPFGSTIEWEDGWTGRFALTRLELRSIFFQPTLSYKISDKIGIGAGFIYSNGKVNLQKDIPVLGSDGNYGHAELNGAASGFGFNAGVYYKPTDKISFGLSYRSQVNMKVDNGEATFTVPSGLAGNFPSGKFSSQLPLPQVLTIGSAYKINEKLDLALDINFVGWKAYDTLSFDYEKNTASLIDTKSARNYRNTYALRLGGQYKITSQFTARLGVSYGITPVKDGFVTPETPDANRVSYTVGLGYKIGDQFAIDASFLFTELDRTDTNLETNLSGRFRTNVCAPGISFSYKF